MGLFDFDGWFGRRNDGLNIFGHRTGSSRAAAPKGPSYTDDPFSTRSNPFERNYAEWWSRPGVSYDWDRGEYAWRHPTRGTVRATLPIDRLSAEIPEEYRGVGARGWYEFTQRDPFAASAFMAERKDRLAREQQLAEERARLNAEIQRGREEANKYRSALIGAIHGHAGAMESEYSPVIQELERRSAPGFEFLGPAVRSAADLAIAQNVARSRAASQAAAAARGTSSGGTHAQGDQGKVAAGHTARVMSDAYLDRENAAARERALAQLGETIRARNAGRMGYSSLEQQVANAGSASDLAYADQDLRTLLSMLPEPYDYYAIPDRAEAQRQYDEYLDMLMRESRLSADDILTTLVPHLLPGGGVLEPLIGALT